MGSELILQRLLWAVPILLSTVLVSFGESKEIFCYYSSFAQTRQGIGKFMPEDIDPFLCSHIIFAFVDISADGRDLRPFNRNDQGPRGLYSRTQALREKNPSLKVLLAVGGWQIGSKPFIPMISSEENRRHWVKNVVQYLRIHGFDGFDLDWEFPATRGSPPDDKYRYTKLMKELYEAFAREARETGNDKLLLTMATASGTYYIDQSYETREIIKYLDYMLLMTYNYHGQWEKITGHHSGLHAHRNDPKYGEKSQLYTQWSIDYWLDVGIPPSKLIIGIATYGMTFTLQNSWNHGVHAPATGGGRRGDYTGETGIMAYYEICMNLKDKDWKREWINDQSVPYTYKGDQWIGYEDAGSVAIKSENILERGLGGAFVWSVEMDDFNDVCDGGSYPLLKTIRRILGNGIETRPAARHKPKPSPIIHEQNDVKINRKSLKVLKKKMQKRGKLRRKLHRSTSSTEYVPLTTTPPSTFITSRIVPSSTRSNKQRLLLRWWSGSLRNKSTKKPVTKTLGHHQRKKPVKVLRKKVQQKRRIKSRSKYPKKRTDIVSWETTPWWQSSSPGAKSTEDVTSHWNARATGKPGFGVQKETTSFPKMISRHNPWVMATTSEITTKSMPIASSAGAIDCRSLGAGTFPDPSSCERFVICMPGAWLDYPPHTMSCPAGTRFDAQLKICNYATQVNC